ncbi:hypothetical protein OPKNFCMD_4058 [Methylobacterium crusticola]|uniref:Uncharacterized protein n=1 Tax=Methylobacterium crusticola TaxID=1697972 RepID=A0ABQ4R361_9HYPH|nr:hypothetical protein OPKNFCMD_4058 [Methylobacterium crusticola]
MSENISESVATCECHTSLPPTTNADTWLDQALADSFPASDPLATY